MLGSLSSDHHLQTDTGRRGVRGQEQMAFQSASEWEQFREEDFTRCVTSLASTARTRVLGWRSKGLRYSRPGLCQEVDSRWGVHWPFAEPEGIALGRAGGESIRMCNLQNGCHHVAGCLRCADATRVGHRTGLGHRALYRGLMDDEATTNIACPTCSAQMDAGWVAIWNPIVVQKVRWQPTEPGYGRLRVPEGARVILEARARGKGGRVAMLCPSCTTIVMPPDATYN